MFNPLEPWEVTLAVGRVLRLAADAGGDLDAYGRSQLLSAASISRHLAAEQAGAGRLLDDFRRDAAALLAGEEGAAARSARERIEDAGGAPEIGEAVGDLLATAREPLRSELHALLRRLADREVELLARAPRPTRDGSE